MSSAQPSTPISIHQNPDAIPLNLASPADNQPRRTQQKMASSTTRPPASSSTTVQQPAERSFFEQQREVLLKEIGVVRLGFCDGGDALTNE
jgi:hypothetical protein